jgi:hypothetical protein
MVATERLNRGWGIGEILKLEAVLTSGAFVEI